MKFSQLQDLGDTMGTLSELQVKAAGPSDSEYVLSDGEGLYLRVGAQSEADLHAWAAVHELVRITPTTITDADRLVAELSPSRQAGFFETRGENVADVWAVSAFLKVGRQTLAVAVAGPQHRMRDKMRDYARHLVTTCSLAARRLQRLVAA